MSKTSDRAYAAIRDLIVSGKLAPGTQLKELELAEFCGVSRTPVREAIRRLETEMFVQKTETQRSFVPNWTEDDVADIFALRIRLEGYVAARAAQRISEQQIQALAAINVELAGILRSSPPNFVEGFLENNRRFHAVLMDAAGSERLRVIVTRIVEPPIVRRTALQFTIDHLRRSYHDHVEMLEALRARDPAWAEAVMHAHIRKAAHAYAISG